MNADHFRGITDYPKLTHGDVEAPNLKDVSAYIKELTGCGVIMPDEPLEDHVRKLANLPERLEAQQFDQSARTQQRRTLREQQNAQIDTEEIAPEDAPGDGEKE